LTFGQSAQYKSCAKYSNLPPGNLSLFSELPKHFPRINSTSVLFENFLGKRKKFLSSWVGPGGQTRPDPCRVLDPLCSLCAIAAWAPGTVAAYLSASASMRGLTCQGILPPNPLLALAPSAMKVVTAAPRLLGLISYCRYCRSHFTYAC
jgi:hypothetical protein